MEQTAHMQNLKSENQMKMKSLMISWMGTLSHDVMGESYVRTNDADFNKSTNNHLL